jgi:hypothetical protein
VENLHLPPFGFAQGRLRHRDTEKQRSREARGKNNSQKQPRISRITRIRLKAKSEKRKAKSEPNMVEELEQEYAALRDKVHDLQEYL